MKKFYILPLLLTAVLVSCEKAEIAPNEDNNYSLTFVADKPATDDATKTAWDGTSVLWKSGDKIRVGALRDGEYWQMNENSTSIDATAAKPARFYSSDALSSDTKTASFKFQSSSSFSWTTTESSYRFYALAPSSLMSDAKAANAPVISVKLPQEQALSSETFDSSADILVGKSKLAYKTPVAAGDEIELVFRREVALLQISFSNLKDAADGELVKSITLTAQDEAKLSGDIGINIVDGSIDASEAVNFVCAKKADGLALSNKSITAWFSTLEFSAESLSVEIVTDKATYTRPIDLSSKNLTFARNKRNTLTINMANAERNVTESTSKSIVIDASTISGFGGSYAQRTWTVGDISGKVFAYRAGDAEPYLMQFNNTPYVYNTTAIPGKITSVTITKGGGTDRSWSVYMSDSPLTSTNGATQIGTAQTVGTSGAVWNVPEGSEYSYFYIQKGSNSTQISSIVIEYEELSGPPAPKFDVAAGTYTEDKIVHISNYKADYIYAYTTDETDPAFDADLNVVSGTVYDNNAGIQITASCTLKAIAVDVDGNPSSIAGVAYVINKPVVFDDLDALVAADITSGTLVTVTLENATIKSFYTSGSYTNGVFLDVQKDGKDIEIYYRNVPSTWKVGGTLSGTITCPWAEYNGTWELVPTANSWAWDNLTYADPAPATITGLTVSGTPSKTTYNEGDAFETAGLTVTATYSDNTTAAITTGFDWTVDYGTGNTALVAGATSVDVMVNIGEDIMSAVYTVTGLTVNTTTVDPEEPGDDDTVTYTFDSLPAVVDKVSTISLDDFSISFNQLTGGNAPAWNSNSSEARLYAKGSLVVSSTTKTIKKIEYSYTINANKSNIAPTIDSVKGDNSDGTWDADTKTWSGSDSSVTFLTSGSAGNIGFTSIKVTFAK